MTLKRLVLIEVIVALFVTFIPVPTFATESDVTSGDVLTSICDEIISYADEKMYNEGYELGYTLGISNREKNYEAPKYPDNKEYMRGLDEGYAKGISELYICPDCGRVIPKDSDCGCSLDKAAEEYYSDPTNCGPCDWCGGEIVAGVDGYFGEHYLHYECEEDFYAYVESIGGLD